MDPDRFGPDLRRRAFTLAVATDRELLDRVHAAVLAGLEGGTGVPTGENSVEKILDAAGVTPANPQYAEMVFRTNSMDSYNQGADDERRAPDVVATLPVWQYLHSGNTTNPRPRHRALDGKYFPASVPFNAVRGSDIADIANCGCTQLPIDRWQWARLRAAGARIAPPYPDVPAGSPRQPPAPARPPPAPDRPAVVHHAGTEPDFRAAVEQAVAALPPNVLAHAAAAGVTVQAPLRVTDVLPHLRGQTPRGWGAGAWESADGLFDPGRGAVVVAQERAAPATGAPERSPRVAGVARHEFGHALDHSLGYLSRTPEFRDAYDGDAGALRAAGRTYGYDYYLQSGEAGPSEAFAEVWAALHGGGASPKPAARFLADWPAVAAFLRERTAEL